MKKILGLDLGTNSIGWAVVNAEETPREDGTGYLKPNSISCAGSRIIPMSADLLGDFDKGNSVSQTAERTKLRMMRRLLERNHLRRERLLRVLKTMEFLPEHYDKRVTRYGKFTDDSEPKLPWRKNAEGTMEFIFQDSFQEMMDDFARHQSQLLADGKKVPYDWTIYYLRKKALTQRISKEELAWILLQFNQKRGYYQLRGEEEEEKANESVEIVNAKILTVEKKEKDKKYEKYWYEMRLDNGETYRASFYNDVTSWEGESKDFILKSTTLKNGTTKTELSFLPTTEEIDRMDEQRKAKMYAKIKLRTEKEIEDSQKTVGCYIYDSLLRNPNQKIIGKLVRTVERKFYKDELTQILKTQQGLIPELKDDALYQRCIEELYASNEAHRKTLSKPDYVNLFVNDILFYQRPLKRKKSLIDDCPYEFHVDKDGNQHPIKCIAKSNPYFQEFRLWQFVQNLRIYQRERTVSDAQLDLFTNSTPAKVQTDVDITGEILKTEEDYVKLFNWLNDRSSIKQDTLLSAYFKVRKERDKDKYPYRWNYVEDKEYPCNETRAAMLSGLAQCHIGADFLTLENERALWHILYSIEDKAELHKALRKFAQKHQLAENFADVMSKTKPFPKEYGSYSEKAVKKLLPLMRMGTYWNEGNIDALTRERIEKIVNGEYDDSIKNRVREKAISLTDIRHFKGLPVWLACYIVYNRHSEAKDIEKWEKPEDIDRFLKNFKQHSLRNPIVEQVVTETLRTVRDIWKQEGQLDEIHVELGREMKNPADKRRQMTERIQQNENTNLRIKAMLTEFLNPDMGIENVRPYSPGQQDILRIYEENALDNLKKEDKDYDFVSKISKTAQPSKSDIVRYKCWLEQKYQSPYTGKMIPLSKLFTPAYEIEHVIPQSRYFDDSLSNKVICEAEVNKLKDRQLGFEFIKNHAGEIVQLSQGGTVRIRSAETYEKFVTDYYSNNRTKMKKLLMDDIPDGFIERQMNDSRYISKVVKGLLSNIVREKGEDGEYEQEAVSKNVISCTGSVTDRLKKDWGMNDVWNNIILPRFKRLNDITGKDCFTTYNHEGHEIPNMPLELQKGFSKKRIDHRHHAMDAIVIACATRDHVNLLNNEAAHSRHNANRYQLQRKLRRFERVTINGKERETAQEFLKPWDSFTADAWNTISNIIVSFKQNQRIINKTSNHYQHFEENGKKGLKMQQKGDSWAVRKSMHKDTVFGEVNLRLKKTVSLNEAVKKPESIVNKEFKKKVKELLAKGRDAKFIKKYIEDNKDTWSDINPSKIEVFYFSKDEKKRNGEPKERYFATRKAIDTSFNMKKIKESVTDTGIQKILLAHLASKDNNPEQAFSPDGIEEMNRNIIALNNGRFHQPILKVRVYEKAEKFAVGQTGNKTKKFVEAAKGTNLFFAFFGTEKENKANGKKEVTRSYMTIPLNIMIDCQKRYGAQWRSCIEEFLREKDMISSEAKLLFILSPNDLVYLPSEDEQHKGIVSFDKQRIYKFIDPGTNTGNFIPFTIAKTIFSIKFTDQKKLGISYPIQDEFGLGSQGSKSPRALTGEMIKETCIPVKTDRLGNVIEINGSPT